MSRRPVLLLDLDDTLVVEQPAAEAAFRATAEHAAAAAALDPARLARDARAHARRLWHTAPQRDWCVRIGVSSWEALWCRFDGDADAPRTLRAWTPAYRAEAWRRALAEQAIADDALARELGERFGVERRARHATFADAAPALDALARSHRLALVTNGAACLQREKLAASGLGDRFEAVVVSGDVEVGAAKPAAAIFLRALALLGAEPAEATMVGDSVVKDVDGALAAGLDAIWLNRHGRPRPAGRAELREIATLAALPAALSTRPAVDRCR